MALNRFYRLITVCAVVGLATACSTDASTTSSSPPPSTAPPLSSAPAELTRKAAVDAFLSAVCPTAYALGVLGNVGVASGGWAEASVDQARPAAKDVINSIEATVKALQSRTDWPSDVRESVPGAADDFVAMVPYLQRMVDARDGRGLKSAWNGLSSLARTQEQRVRTALGLGLAGTKNDGCPDVPKVAAPSPSENREPAGQQPSAATGDMPQLNSQMIEATGDGLCTTPVYRMSDLVGPNSDSGWTRAIQVMAVLYGFNPGVIDGQYGPNTVSAVQGLQSYLGVVPDGQVGPITWTALQNDYCGGPPPY